MTKQDFAKRLRSLKRGRRASNHEIAVAVGVSKQAVTRWLSGDAMPKQEYRKSLADLFGVSEHWLFTGAVDVPPGYPERVLRLAERCARLSEKRLALIELLVSELEQ